jgi:hypothetical protein
MGRSAIWCGSGYQRFLIGFCLSQVDIGDDKLWLGWAYLTKKVPHAATTPIATAFKICISHRKNGLLNHLPFLYREVTSPQPA